MDFPPPKPPFRFIVAPLGPLILPLILLFPSYSPLPSHRLFYTFMSSRLSCPNYSTYSSLCGPLQVPRLSIRARPLSVRPGFLLSSLSPSLLFFLPSLPSSFFTLFYPLISYYIATQSQPWPTRLNPERSNARMSRVSP